MLRLNISLRLIAVLALLGSPCDAQMTLTGAGGTAAPVGGFSTYVFEAAPAIQDSPGSTTVTFSSVAIGPAASNRVVVVCNDSTNFVATALTIGGVSATKDIEESTQTSGLQLWHATVPTGTTANIVETYGSNPSAVAITVGYFDSGASATPGATTSAKSASATSLSESLNIPTSGFALACEANAFSTTTAVAWTNTTAGAGDAFIGSPGTGVNLASSHSTTVGTPTTITAAPNSVASALHMVAASWGP